MRDFSDLELRALRALLECGSVAEAAKACKVSQATLYRYLQDKDFKNRLRGLRCESLEHSIQSLQNYTSEAAEALRRFVYDEKCPYPVRASSARAIIELAFNGAKLADFNQRIEEVEAMVAELRKPLESSGSGPATGTLQH